MKAALSLVILAYLIIDGLWLSPPSHWRTRLLQPVQEAWEFIGLNQSYCVFAPDIKDTNRDLTAVISFSDGTRKLWLFPQSDDFPGLSSYKLERTRKWMDWLYSPSGEFLLPDAARYI